MERFWSKVDKSGGPDACWPWLGTAGRYGSILWRGRRTGAHRIACELTHGPAPEDKPNALHSRKCTTRLCCNGAHLRWGTQKENNEDTVATGRHGGNYKLTARQIALLVDLGRRGVTQAALGKLFGVHRGHTSKLLKRSRN